MFSITTIASSTTNPVADGQAMSDKLSRREAEGVHCGEGADQRDRHGDHGNKRGARIAEKDEHDPGDQANRDQQRDFNVANRGADGGGAVENDGEVNPLWHNRLQKRQLRPNALDGAG